MSEDRRRDYEFDMRTRAAKHRLEATILDLYVLAGSIRNYVSALDPQLDRAKRLEDIGEKMYELITHL